MTINIKNARRLVERLEAKDNPVKFHMGTWFNHNKMGIANPREIYRIAKEHSCGTAACLAGHAALEAWESGDMEVSKGYSVQEVAQEWLGLTNWRANSLFHGQWDNKALDRELGDLTKAEAITELNRLIELSEEGSIV